MTVSLLLFFICRERLQPTFISVVHGNNTVYENVSHGRQVENNMYLCGENSTEQEIYTDLMY